MNLRKKLSWSEMIDHIEMNKAYIKMLYITKDMSAKDVAENQNIAYSSNWNKALYRFFGAKGKGHGGSRQNSGNKKGIQFCGECRKQKKDCICD